VRRLPLSPGRETLKRLVLAALFLLEEEIRPEIEIRTGSQSDGSHEREAGQERQPHGARGVQVLSTSIDTYLEDGVAVDVIRALPIEALLAKEKEVVPEIVTATVTEIVTETETVTVTETVIEIATETEVETAVQDVSGMIRGSLAATLSRAVLMASMIGRKLQGLDDDGQGLVAVVQAAAEREAEIENVSSPELVAGAEVQRGEKRLVGENEAELEVVSESRGGIGAEAEIVTGIEKGEEFLSGLVVGVGKAGGSLHVETRVRLKQISLQKSAKFCVIDPPAGGISAISTLFVMQDDPTTPAMKSIRPGSSAYRLSTAPHPYASQRLAMQNQIYAPTLPSLQTMTMLFECCTPCCRSPFF